MKAPISVYGVSITIKASEPVPNHVRRLLSGLPEWFGIESAVDEYVCAAQRLPTLIATTEDGEIVAVLLHERHFAEATEIHLLAVDRAWHRRGVGRALIDTLARKMQADGARLLSVKTLGPSHPDAGYAATREFYRACGFLPVEELHGLWPENPCLVLVKHLDSDSG